PRVVRRREPESSSGRRRRDRGAARRPPAADPAQPRQGRHRLRRELGVALRRRGARERQPVRARRRGQRFRDDRQLRDREPARLVPLQRQPEPRLQRRQRLRPRLRDLRRIRRGRRSARRRLRESSVPGPRRAACGLARRAVPALRGAALIVAALALLADPCGAQSDDSGIVIAEMGAFAVGGTVLGDPASSSLSCDHGVVEYQIPARARGVNLWMWHSASAVAWQRRWDGGEGFQSIFLRRGFPVYLWDGPRVGRANWGCGSSDYSAEIGRDQRNFVAWRFGPYFPEWFDNVQFPKDDPEAWNQAARARYQEFDSIANARLQASAAAKLADRIGPTVALTN